MPTNATNGGNARVCGCSSMVEQKLPKLHTTAEISPTPSKTPSKTGLSFQRLGFRGQNIRANFRCPDMEAEIERLGEVA